MGRRITSVRELNFQKVIRRQKKARLEDKGKAKLAIEKGLRKGKRIGKQVKKRVSWKNQKQQLEKGGDEALEDEPEPLASDSNKHMSGQNEEMVSHTFAVIYIQFTFITYITVSRL
jgi:2-oxoglutarate dehydrogenase complex dehydrogenase (E1) component-like enzyme